MLCPICLGNDLEKSKNSYSNDRCNNCKDGHGLSVDGYIVDDYFYPETRRGQLCQFFTPVSEQFDIASYVAGQTITFKTSKGNIKEATVLHTWKGEGSAQMIIRQNKKHMILIEERVIKEAFDELAPINKARYQGWWNKRISII